MRLHLALVRKTGYVSTYTLAMIYPSYRKGVFYQGSKGEWVAPIVLASGYDRVLFQVPPWLIRFPSWIARKVLRRDENGQVR